MEGHALMQIGLTIEIIILTTAGKIMAWKFMTR